LVNSHASWETIIFSMLMEDMIRHRHRYHMDSYEHNHSRFRIIYMLKLWFLIHKKMDIPPTIAAPPGAENCSSQGVPKGCLRGGLEHLGTPFGWLCCVGKKQGTLW
jgi:hypothetical protein